LSDWPEAGWQNICGKRKEYSPGSPIIFDEIHKRKDWKKILKGYYDSPDKNENFIITGSGRFDIFRKGGDSLQGRYDLFHLFPLIFDEIRLQTKKITPVEPRDFSIWLPKEAKISDSDLISLGGFPAPYLSGSNRSMQKWNDLYIERLVKEDIRDFSNIIKIDQLVSSDN